MVRSGARGAQLRGRRAGSGPGACPGCAGPVGRGGDQTSPRVAFWAPAGKRSGDGYVEFETPEDAQKALEEKQHAHLSTRYIE